MLWYKKYIHHVQENEIPINVSSWKSFKYLSAWLTIMRTVINEYPWKNPLSKKERILLSYG